MGRVVHFEIHASQPQAAIEFYSAMFGWRIERWGEMDYWAIFTGDEGPGINGGLVPRRGPSPEMGAAVASFVCTVQVDSVDEALARAVELGGTVALPKMPIPTIGWLAYFKDPDGNLVGVMSEDTAAE